MIDYAERRQEREERKRQRSEKKFKRFLGRKAGGESSVTPPAAAFNEGEKNVSNK